MTLVKDRKTGDSMLQCDSCPDTYPAPEPGTDPRDLKRAAEAEGWKAVREAAAWWHYCRNCANHRKGRLL